MGDDPESRPAEKESDFARQVGAKAARKLRVQRQGPQGVWFGLGMSGLIGWSVTVPTIAGAMLGLWLDRHHGSAYSWTLMLMAAGLVIGCLNAWHWLARQDKAMRDETEDEDE
jgi:ATP synthase protein I